MTDSRAIISDQAIDLYRRLTHHEQPAAADEEALSGLLNLGLIRHTLDGRYSPADPGYVGAKLAAEFHAEASRQLGLASVVADAFEPLSAVYAGRPADGDGVVEYLRGVSVINARLGQVLAGCTEELLASQPGGPRRAAILATVRERDLATLGSGVRMRTIYHEDARAGNAMPPWVQDMTAAGAEIRTLDRDFPRMIVIDRRIAVIPGEGETVARIVHDSGVAAFLADHLFSFDWAQARAWGGEAAPVQTHVDGRRERILALLEQGKSLKEIATRLKVSQRKLAEIIAEMKASCGAETLFQLACLWKAASGRGGEQ